MFPLSFIETYLRKILNKSITYAIKKIFLNIKISIEKLKKLVNRNEKVLFSFSKLNLLKKYGENDADQMPRLRQYEKF